MFGAPPGMPQFTPPRRDNPLVKFAKDKPLGTIGGIIAILFIVIAILAPVIAPHDPIEIDPKLAFAAPNSDMILGGDHIGRDVFSRMVYGARTSLLVGALSVLFGVTIGLAVWLVISRFSGKALSVVGRVLRVALFLFSLDRLLILALFRIGPKWLREAVRKLLLALEVLIWALIIMAVQGASVTGVIIAMSIVFIPCAAITFRSLGITIWETGSVPTGQDSGGANRRMMTRQIAAAYIAVAATYMGWAILLESSLSFLGIAVPPNVPSWGGMLQSGVVYWEIAWWMVVFPGLAIVIAVFAWNRLGDALQDVLAPTERL